MDKKVKRRVIALGVLAFLLAVLGGGFYASKIISKSSTESGAGQNAVVRQEEKHHLTLDEQVDEIVSSMSTTEKIGQLLMIGVQGTTANEDSLYVYINFIMAELFSLTEIWRVRSRPKHW
jgi:beta-N-acetylhexosaminidase